MDGSTQIICVGTMSADVPLPPLGSIGPNGGFVSVLHVTDALVSIKIFQLQFQLQLLIYFYFSVKLQLSYYFSYCYRY